MFYVVTYENGVVIHGKFSSYNECLDFIDSLCIQSDYHVSGYNSEDEYFNSIIY